MIFDFKNIGIVESAEIEIKGLTVLTGLNDTGKSFLSKGIFSIIKTNREASKEIRDAKFQLLQQRFRTVQQIESYSLSGLQPDIIKQLEPVVVANILYANIIKIWNSSLDVNIDEVIAELEKYKERIKNTFSKNTYQVIVQTRDNQLKNLDTNISNIINALSTRIEEPNKDYINFYNTVILPQLFKNQLNSLNNKESELSIKIEETGVNVTVKNNKCEIFNGSINASFNDAIYIESPTSLQLVPFISNALAFGGNLVNVSQQRLAGLPYHIYDLVNKIVNNVNNQPNTDFENYTNDIRATIGGKLFYDQVSRSVIYTKESGANIIDVNIASGIKGFGIMDILFSENILNKKTLLIIDEPEVHLHPKWEINFAELIVKLSSIDIPILISSHSSYFIKALTKYIKQYGTQNKTKFYFGEKISGNRNSTFEDVTDKLDPIFTALAKPMADTI